MDSAPLHQRADTTAISTNEAKTKSVYKPKGLDITWGNDKRYWKTNNEAAELVEVSWLEVTGTFDGKLGKTYKISFEISIEPHAFGWEGIKIFVLAKVGKRGKYNGTHFYLDKYNTRDGKLFVPSPELHLNVSDSSATSATNDLKIYFGLYEVFSGVWKGGLKIYKAIVEEV